MSSGLLNPSAFGVIAYTLLLTHITIAAVTIFLHRHQAHRALTLHPVASHFFRFWLWLTTGMVTRQWVAVHRKHHARCETADDPHSPQVLSLKKVLLEGAELYRREADNGETLAVYGKGTPDDAVERRLYSRYPYLGIVLMLALDVLLLGPIGITVWAVQMIWIPLFAAGVINGIGHYFGYRTYASPDAATNIVPWGILIGGEELHNNHHAFPSSSRFALRRFEFDIGWVAIRGLQAVGLATVRRVAPQLDIRPNIALPDTDTLRAVLVHRFQVMSDYFRGVIMPTLRAEAQQAGDALRALPRRMRKALINGGRWLDDDASTRLREFIAQRPDLVTVYEFRQRLRAVYERSGQSSDAMLESLRQWCREAEASGNDALAQFAERLKGYALVPARA